MSLLVEVISTEMVKPSSPTPKHLRHYNLSFLAQIAPQLHNSMVYFFNADDVINGASNLLKKSLSQVLTHFYPLAGRLMYENLLVDCNDDGVPYTETRVRCHVSHVVDNPSPDDVSKLLPYDIGEVADDTVLSVQFNVFDCGGIAVGVCLSHKLADALSGAVAKGEMVVFSFTSLCRFPVDDVDFGWGIPTLAVPPTTWKVKNLVTLKDAKSDGGIEAYVSLAKDDMVKFERTWNFLLMFLLPSVEIRKDY